MGSLKLCWISIVLMVVFNYPCRTAYAQDSNQRCKWVSSHSKNIILDTLLVAGETIELQHPEVEFTFDINTGELTLAGSNLPDSLRVCYRTFPQYFNQSHHHRTYDAYDSLAPFKAAVRQQAGLVRREELFASEGIYKSGSITRGVSFGNSRSLGVTSSLNFEMEGALTDDLNIRANITDQNVPFQPEGNTQQLREFDNVSIEVFNEKLSLRAGDIVLQSPESNFLKYYKNVQGGQFNVGYGVGEKGKGESSVTISSAKGQFADVTIKVQEGVQGPYKLRGPNGERFVIVLANSENIYLDGRRLERGFNQDYVIDYNLGEITFNPSVLITRFSRVRATYEYSDRNYSRAIINTNHRLQTGKTTITLNHYQEKDSKNNPLSFDLSDEDKLAISLAGEKNLPVPIEGGAPSEYSAQLVLYQKKDTIDQDGKRHSIFLVSRDSTQVLYRVTFSDVGFGNGDYELQSTTANGRIYEWISPIAGEQQGGHAAVLFVPAPNSRQMTTLGAEVSLSRYSRAYSELAISSHDLNLFSSLDDGDNSGMAVKSGFEISKKPINFIKGYKLSSSVDFEHDSKNFNAIDRFRYIEFDRDWSFDPEQEEVSGTDNIFNLKASLEKNAANKLAYKLAKRKRGGSVDGLQQQATIDQEVGAFELSSGAYWMKNKSRYHLSDWKKAHGQLAMDKFVVVPGYRFELDQNELKNLESDSVLSSAMNYMSHTAFLESNDSLQSQFKIEYTSRRDRQPVSGVMDDFTSTNTTRINFDSDLGRTNHIDLTFTYRTLDYLKSFSGNPSEETVLGKINWNGTFFDSHLRADMSYATASSREIRREFIFVPVVSGEGTHTWRDLNEDGVQDITEFFEAINFDERNYIKLFVPTDEFIAAFNNLLNLNVSTSMPRQWSGSGGLKGVLARFSSRTSVNINKKNTDKSFNSRFNPFQLATDNGDLIFVKDAVRNTLFYNRSNPGFGFDIGYFAARSKQLISSGIDSRNQLEWVLNTRKQITSELSVLWKAMKGRKENQSDFFQGKNYTIVSHSFAPQIVWQPTASFRLSSEAAYKKKEDIQAESLPAFSRITSFNTSMRWSRALRNTLDASVKFTNISFLGEENSPAGYELLEALKPGNNVTWNFNYQQKLVNGLQVSISYDGRKSVGQKVIHLGRMQVTALF